MSKEISIYICETDAKAEQAAAFLRASGYSDANIKKEKADNLIYDAATYDSDGGSYLPTNKYIVTGRK